MKKTKYIAITLIGIGIAAGLYAATRKPAARRPELIGSAKMNATIAKLKPIHKKITPPKAGDWLAEHKETGQTFRQYFSCRPVKPQGTRSIIYIQPIGDFTKTQRKIVVLTADYMERFFNREVKIKKDIPLSVIPDRARRVHPSWGMKQILSTYVLDDVLRPRLPKDAAAFLAFTASDLWPGRGWNFVFGQASIRQRVGVWSIYRNGDPEKNDDSYKLCLMRTIKTAVHETAHMFSMLHCILYECCMCGSNHREESDRRPLWLCPECTAKICWATQTDPSVRYAGLAEFCTKHGFKKEADFYHKSIKQLGK